MSSPSISIVVPAFNEGSTLRDVLQRIEAYRTTLVQYRCELIVIDDGSTDETGPVIAAFAREFPMTRVVTHARNLGLPEAIRSGFRIAHSDTIVVLDADLSYAPDIVEPLVAALHANRAAVAIASPYMAGGLVRNVPFDRLLASRCANILLSGLVGGRVKTLTGMVRAYDRATIRGIVARDLRGEFNAGILAEVVRQNLAAVEIPAALIWPETRRSAPSRMSFPSLVRRIRLVLVTATVLIAAGRARRCVDP